MRTTIKITLHTLACLLCSLNLYADWQPPATDISAIIGNDAEFSQLAISSSGNAIAVWYVEGAPGDFFIKANRYDATTKTWLGIESISNTALGSNAQFPQVAMNASGNAMVVWEELYAGVWIIYGNYFNATTQLWSGPMRVSISPYDSHHARVAMDNAGNAMAVYSAGQTGTSIVTSAFYDITVPAWNVFTDLSNFNQKAYEPDIAMNGDGKAIAIWRIELNNKIQASYFDGTNWISRGYLPNATHALPGPHIAIDHASNGIAVWEMYISNTTVQTARCNGTTLDWTTANTLSTPNVQGDLSQIAMDGAGNGIAVWREIDGSTQSIQTKRYDATSTTWSSATQLSEPGNPTNPQIAMDDDGNGIAVWQNVVGALPSVIQQSRYDVKTARWLQLPGTNLTDISQNSVNPHVAMNDALYNGIAIWEYENDGGTVVVQAERFEGIPEMPTNLKLACSLHRFPTQADFIHKLTWDPVDIATSYKVYDDAALTHLLGTITQSDTPSITLHRRKICCPITYYVTAIDESGAESLPASVSYCQAPSTTITID